MSGNQIIDIFKKLEYGQCPEADNHVRAWCKAHNDGKFGLFINNEWVYPEDRKYSTSYSPADKKPIADTMEGTDADINTAVDAAKTAHTTWSKLPGYERAKHLYSLARHVQKHARLLSVLEALDNGKPFRETKSFDVPQVIRHLYYHAGWAQLMDTELKDYEPLSSPVGLIVPFNFPIMLLMWKVAPALAMGNTVVIKPASYTRLSALLFAEICAEAGLPPGVLNVITGSGRIGSTLADHPDVSKIAFTGSTGVGQLLRRRLAGSGKKISLELGGKSPVIVFNTADIDSAVEGIIDAIFFNQGQVCCGGSRALVQEDIYPTFVAKLKQRLVTWKIGHSLAKDIDMGALVDESQYKTIKSFVDLAEKEGCDVYKAPVPVPENGWFWPPTVITNVEQCSHIVQEEIFGPVVTVQSFRTEGEAITLANNNKYGLGGSIWTENISIALEVAINIKAGAVWINGHNIMDSAAGFGGYKESGMGRDGGKEGLYEYIKPKWEKRVFPTTLTFPMEKPIWPKADDNDVLPAPLPIIAQSNVLESKLNPVTNLPQITIDRTAKLYVNGAQKRSDGEYVQTVYNNDKTKVIGHVSYSNRKDIRDAVTAASNAQSGWGKRAGHNRAQIMYYLAENLMQRNDEFVARIIAQTGVSDEDAQKEVDVSISRLFYYAAYADKYGGEVKETNFYGFTCSTYEPMGTIGVICPEKYPLLGFISLIAPLIIRGNTVVVIPSQTAPLCATDLYQVFETSDLPNGVVNIITGDKDQLTKTLVEHKDIQSVWYHGNEQMCANVEYSAADNMKRTWVNYGVDWPWFDDCTQGGEFLRRSVEVKHIWIPIGDSVLL
jgi:aldehyde dehydrogenase (NAD+)